MTWSDALLSFVSVFAAAALAFYLDSLRERRTTRRWVWEYLRFWRALLATLILEWRDVLELFDEMDRTLTLLTAGQDEPTQEQWERVDVFALNTTIVLTPPLLGEASGVVPPQVLHKLFLADEFFATVRNQAAHTAQMFESLVRPVVLRQVWPLEAEMQRGVGFYQRELAEFRSLLEQLARQLAELVAELQAIDA